MRRGPAHQPRAFALEVVETLIEAGHEAVWAGGCVRDLLMGREPGDFDIATDARPDQVRKVFGRARSFAVGASFGVVLVRDRDGREDPVEVATFRTEGAYADGRHPDAVQFATRQDDARRRDFTINGMFMDPRTGDVFDDVGGRQDIERGLVRAIGEPEARINEDKLRMLRAIRFTASLEFALDPATAEAIASHAEEISVVSAERIADEGQVPLHRYRKTSGQKGHLVPKSPRIAHGSGIPGVVNPKAKHNDGRRESWHASGELAYAYVQATAPAIGQSQYRRLGLVLPP